MNDVRKGINETLKVKLGEATGKDWMDEADNLSKEDREKYIAAIETLLSWPMFKEEWGWTGLSGLKGILMSSGGNPSTVGQKKSVPMPKTMQHRPEESEELPK